ncbi:hypothetical protein KCU88_g241, partial [Aureobasidium melanogenum]
LQIRFHCLNLLLTGKEDEYVARALRDVDLENSGDGGSKIIGFWLSCIMNIHRVSATRDIKDWCVIKSGLARAISFSNPQAISVLTVRSCASSIIRAEYWDNSGSVRSSLSSIPSVMYLSTVLSLVLSSKRMAYPTSFPSRFPISSATLAATDIAATLRGCVQPIFFPLAHDDEDLIFFDGLNDLISELISAHGLGHDEFHLLALIKHVAIFAFVDKLGSFDLGLRSLGLLFLPFLVFGDVPLSATFISVHVTLIQSLLLLALVNLPFLRDIVFGESIAIKMIVDTQSLLSDT